MQTTLYYVHDPMCSWCWAFEQARGDLLARLPGDLPVVRLLGGLAKDTDSVMPMETREYVKTNWRAIEKKLPHIRFNYDFWDLCTPRRATYPACRAVIAARQQGVEFDEAMTRAIQNAYYGRARNPSEQSVLINLAGELELDVANFTATLLESGTQQILLDEMTLARQMGATSFPSLVLQIDTSAWRVPTDYQHSDSMLEMINILLEQSAADRLS
jgi:putative protein-disulfide isomerase